MRRHELEAGRQRNLVVAVIAGYDAIVVADLLVHEDIQPLLGLRRRAVQRVPGLAGIHQRTEQVEAGGHAQGAPDRADELHPVGEQRGVEVADARLVQGAPEHVRIGAEFGPVALQDGAGAADGRTGPIAVFRHLVAGAGDDESRAGGDVERVLAVTAGADDVQRVVRVQVDVPAGFQQAVAEPQQFLHGDPAGLDGHQQGGHLAVIVLLLRDSQQDVVGLLPGEGFTFDELVQICFHRLVFFNDSTNWR